VYVFNITCMLKLHVWHIVASNKNPCHAHVAKYFLLISCLLAKNNLLQITDTDYESLSFI